MTHPFFWPHVTRGAEREIHDAGERLVQRGHRVDLLTSQPAGVTSRAVVDGIRVRYVRSPAPRSLQRRGWRPESCFGAVAAAGALASSADAVISYLYADALGAATASRVPGRRRPVVLKLTGSVPRDWSDRFPVDRALVRRALERCSEVWVNSAYVVEAMSGWGVPMRVVPAGIDPEVFRPSADRSTRPRVFCASAPAEPRKRVADLLAAWPAVLDALPDAELVVAQQVSDELRRELLEPLPESARASVAFTGPLETSRLVEEYSRASAVAAPALYEALGLTTLEALSCGTPVVGADSGATPELLAEPGTGATYDPTDLDALAAALVQVVTSDPDREACRAAAAPYAWDRIIDTYEQRLTALTR